MLNRIHVEIVVDTSEVSFLTNESKASLILFKKPPASITPLNIMAMMISQTVFSIPSIPRVDSNASMLGEPVKVPFSRILFARQAGRY